MNLQRAHGSVDAHTVDCSESMHLRNDLLGAHSDGLSGEVSFDHFLKFISRFDQSSPLAFCFRPLDPILHFG